jgi:hypothetical protein
VCALPACQLHVGVTCAQRAATACAWFCARVHAQRACVCNRPLSLPAQGVGLLVT